MMVLPQGKEVVSLECLLDDWRPTEVRYPTVLGR
jgi:hypothetical protein